jgi:hypothetical protein
VEGRSVEWVGMYELGGEDDMMIWSRVGRAGCWIIDVMVLLDDCCSE